VSFVHLLSYKIFTTFDKILFVKTSFLSLFLLFSGLALQAQSPTLGLLYKSANVSDGYTLFTPSWSNNVFLIDNCGELVNEWKFGEIPGAVCYLLENGNLLRAGKDTIEIRDWDDSRVWHFALNANLGVNQHHDIEILPNGNILCLLTDNISSSDMFDLGKDTVSVPGLIKLDRVIEIQPVGLDSAFIVWDWRFLDHLIQDFDSGKPGFGVIADYPELLDINYPTFYTVDFTHCNGIDYNADLDQIMLSARSLDEILIIDHSTTTAEAAGHTGGNSNMGGDFLFRWGNPAVYQQGTSADRKLFIQHDPKWIPSNYLDGNKISIYSNGGDSEGTNYSSAVIIDPVINNGVYAKSSGKFLPLDYDWTWKGVILGDTMRQGKMSGLHTLPNGNFIVCETSKGQISEISKAGVVEWVYKNPRGSNDFLQFEVILANENSMFRAEKYPSDYIGFQGKDLTGIELLEGTNAISDTCSLTTGIKGIDVFNIGIINPIKDGQVRFNEIVEFDRISIYDLQGKLVETRINFYGQSFRIELVDGLYILKLAQGTAVQSAKIIVH
jgi:hypothetical protein